MLKDEARDFAAYSAETQRRPTLENLLAKVLPSRADRMMRSRVGMAKFRYEAAQVTRLRAWHGSLQLPPESMATKVQRTKMLMSSREAVENDPFVNGILRKYEVYTAGTLRYQADTGDDVLDEAINQYFNEQWCNDCDVTGRFTFQDLVLLAIREEVTVGDCGLVWVRDVDGELRLQFIEGDRIGHPYQGETERDYMNGITVSPLGRPISYRVFVRNTQSANYTSPTEIPAQDFIHYFTPTRNDVYRGIPKFHAVINILIDLREIREAMQVKVKNSSLENFFINNLTGLPTSQDVFNGQPLAGVNGQPGQIFTSEMGRYRFGSENEKITETTSSFPAPQIQTFYDNILIMTVANALNLSYGLIRDMASLKGPGVRAVLAQDDREFGLRRTNLDSKLLSPAVKRVLFDAALRRKIAGANPFDANLYKGRFYFPGKLTIDVGRDAQQNVLMNNNALQPAAEIYGDEGEDWRDGLRQCVREQVYLNTLCEKYDIPVESIRRIQSSVAGRVLPADPAQQVDAESEAQGEKLPGENGTQNGQGAGGKPNGSANGVNGKSHQIHITGSRF